MPTVEGAFSNDSVTLTNGTKINKGAGSYVFKTYSPDSFVKFTDSYPGLKKSYNDWLYDSENIHWADYVRINSDLEQYWQWNKDGYLKNVFGRSPSRWDFGWYHYNELARKDESRDLPKVVEAPGDLNNDGTGRNDMRTIIVRQNKGSVMDDTITRASFGNYHFNTPGVQQSAKSFIPGEAPSIIYNENGDLEVVGIGGDGVINLLKKIKNQVKDINASGRYKSIITNIANALNNNGLLQESKDNNTLDALNAYYSENKVTPWDPDSFGDQPPTGGFDAKFYGEKERPDALTEWNDNKSFTVNGVTFDDLDYTARYTPDTYLHWHYTTKGKVQKARGNEAKPAEFATGYEEKLTDKDLQDYRDSVLGLDKKEEDGDWEVDWEDETKSLLEQQVAIVLQSRDAQEQARFAALTQDALKQASDELLKAKRQEANLDMFRGLPIFNDIFNANETLANSLLGDSGVGGILSMTGKNIKAKEEDLAKQFSAFTGIPSNNSTIYNWQKWFDDTLVKRYEDMTEIADTADADVMLEIDQNFANAFIEDYLKPRFDQSKSMDEFISYMDVEEEEQNIFQTQDAINSLKQTASLKAKQRYEELANADTLRFDADFYFNPTTDKEISEEKKELYKQQKNEVEKDWEDAKENGSTIVVVDDDNELAWTWDQWAYWYGLDIEDEKQFAQLHYQVKGAKKGFDPAEDITSYADLQDYITTTVVPAVEAANLKIGEQPFLQFTTPEEFADSLLEAVDPLLQKEEWKKLLEIYGLDSEVNSVEEVRDYIIESLRTNQAQDIRESLKYLNENKIRPTQYRLGVSYIERAEDEKTVETEETPLYKLFKNSGYGGTEEEFYDEFMSDTSKSEQEFLGKALSGDLKLNEIFSDDPFEVLSNVSSLFQEEADIFGSPTDKEEEEADTSSSESSYFRLFEDEEISEKSDSTQSFIDEFTSLFKGFK